MPWPWADSSKELMQLEQGVSPQQVRGKENARKHQPGHQVLSLLKTASLAAISESKSSLGTRDV